MVGGTCLEYIAHIRESDKKEQPVLDHLLQTEQLARTFAKPFHGEEFAGICARLHDIGKYSNEFQNRIRNAGKPCDHSTAGAKVIYEQKPLGKLAAYCISGHHSGLLDCGHRFMNTSRSTLYGRLADSNHLPDYLAYQKEINGKDKLPIPDIRITSQQNSGFSFAFYTRMIYSCLTDADFLDTEHFMNPMQERKEGDYPYDLLEKSLERKLNSLSNPEGLLNQTRTLLLNQCLKSADRKRGLFQLSIPTGGGKTIASLAFAMKHLQRNHMSRIIYVIPYTSIIEQNAKVFSDIFGANYVLEHHSNYDFDNLEDPYGETKKLASENWDMPLIVTTNVQFFESLFANKSSRCRKLHNISNSVIIFDEAQMLPVDYLTPCTRSIMELVQNYKCSAVLCSATQPALETFIPSTVQPQNICELPNDMLAVFQRTKMIIRGELDDESLIEETNQMHQCLIIVNTKKHAKALFEKLPSEGSYHLSTCMCPIHRKKIIAEIKQKLKDNKECKVVSTQLIEAGVDIDFPVVYRELAGLDSLVQSAGRCNREGKLMDHQGNAICGDVYVFEPEEQYRTHIPYSLRLPIAVTKEIIKRYPNPISVESIHDYFSMLYHQKGEEGTDIKGIVSELDQANGNNPKGPDDLFNFNFASIAVRFQLLEQNTYSVVIPYDGKAKELIEQLEFTEYPRTIYRALQPYTVSVYQPEYEALHDAGQIKIVSDNTAVLNTLSFSDTTNYSEQTGLKVDTGTGFGFYL